MNRVIPLIGALCALVAPAADADLRVFACEPEWGALARELGGDDIEAYTATTAQQDPHYVEARPSLIARVRGADLVVCTGADLEAGWLPMLLRRAANSDVQPGRPGHLAAADHVRLLERPERVDRAMGDVHPDGNPHIHTDPRNVRRVAEVLVERMAELDPQRADAYRGRHATFDRRFGEAIARWETKAASLEGTRMVTYHRGWIYMNRWLGLETVAHLEPKPGVPPSSGHLADVLARLREQPAHLVIRAPYQDPRPARWLAERADVPEVVLPFTVGGAEDADDLFGLYEVTIERLLEAAP